MCKCSGKCGCNITKTTKGEKGDSSSFATLGYRTYVALLSQSGTDAPEARVLQNTLTGDLTWTRTGAGNYLLTSSEYEFIEDKTIVLITVDNVALIQAYWNTTDVIAVDTQNSAAVASDDKMIDTSIEIRVYN